MGNNTPGLIAYASVLIGAAAAGLWLIALAEGMTDHSIIAGVVALVLGLGGIGTLTAIHLVRHIDPIEPENSPEEIATYRSHHAV